MYKKLSEIYIVRPDSPEEHKFINIGRLIYNPSTHKAKAYMLGWTLGWVRAYARFTEIDPLPYLQDDLTAHICNTINNDGGVVTKDKHELKVGRIITSDNEEGKVTYSIELLVMPALQYNYGQAGVWLEISGDDHDTD